jgi:hypothetical protein
LQCHLDVWQTPSAWDSSRLSGRTHQNCQHLQQCSS